MEQQPGPVNWASWNPSPSPGMVRLWAWEALAHGADVVSFFRWRQAPFAQEQMHAGLNRVDNVLDVGGIEAAAVAYELEDAWWQEAANAPARSAPVALVFDYEAAWMHAIQPQGRNFSQLALVFTWYTALRRLGVDIDIVAPGADLGAYRAVFVPSLPYVNENAANVLAAFRGLTLFGIRSGAKTESFQIPGNLAPGPLQRLLPLKVARVESLRPGVSRTVSWGNRQFACGTWVETLEMTGNAEVMATFATGAPALVAAGSRLYLAAWPSPELATEIAQHMLAQAGVETISLHEDMRLRRRGRITFAFNYGTDSREAPSVAAGECVLGAQMIGAHNLSAWKN
jgi:beta-galactosidase